MRKYIAVIAALGVVTLLNAAVTANWKTKSVSIDYHNKTWEFHEQYYIGSQRFNTSWSTSSAAMIPAITNQVLTAEIIQDVFDAVEAYGRAQCTAVVEAELGS